jgi:hypothetical protein
MLITTTFHGSDNPNLGLIGQRVNAAHSQHQSSVYRRNKSPTLFGTNRLRSVPLIDTVHVSDRTRASLRENSAN